MVFNRRQDKHGQRNSTTDVILGLMDFLCSRGVVCNGIIDWRSTESVHENAGCRPIKITSKSHLQRAMAFCLLLSLAELNYRGTLLLSGEWW